MGADAVEVREQMDVGALLCDLMNALVNLQPLRVIVRKRPNQRELEARYLLSSKVERLDNARLILPGVKPRYLDHERTAKVDAELRHFLATAIPRQASVLGRQRSACRRHKRE